MHRFLPNFAQILCFPATRLKGDMGMRWYLLAFRNYVNFSDRARRKEYWMFTLVNAFILFPLEVTIQILIRWAPAQRTLIVGLLVLMLIYALVVFLPSLSLVVRRLHDQNRSGIWMLLWVIPAVCMMTLNSISSVSTRLVLLLVALVLSIWMLMLMWNDGTCGFNQYGADPKNRHSRAPDEPMKSVTRTVAAEGTALAARITGLRISKPQADLNETVTAEIAYENSNAKDQECVVTLYVNGIVRGKQRVNVPANSCGAVSMPLSFADYGEYTVKSGDFSKKILVL